MFEVYEGKDSELAEKVQRQKHFALKLGFAQQEIYLNGGSDSRRDTIEYWKLYASILEVPIKIEGNCKITIG